MTTDIESHCLLLVSNKLSLEYLTHVFSPVTCKREIEHGLCACTVDNPIALCLYCG